MPDIAESLLGPGREDQAWKAIRQITGKDGANVGCGCLVYDPKIENTELSKYCIISSSKDILRENLPEYHILFERVSNPKKPHDILLRDIIKKDFFLGSGLILIFINGTSPQLRHHGSLHIKCSVLKHLPEISSPHEGRETFYYSEGKHCKYGETSGINSPGNAGSVANGCFLFESDGDRKFVVGIINCVNNAQGDISPIWLTSSSLEEIIHVGEFLVVEYMMVM